MDYARLNPQIAPDWVRHYAPVVLILLALAAFGAWLANFIQDHETSKPGTVVIATPAHEVKGVPKVGVEVKTPVKVYKGGAGLKGGLKLPPEVIASPTTEVLASSSVKADDHPQTITTVLDTATGESQTYVRTDPLPWFALDSRGEVGAYVGLKNSEPAVRIQARQDLFDVKALRFGAIGSIDVTQTGKTETFIGLGGSWHW